MTTKFSPSEISFFPDDVDYGDKLPTDLIEISDDVYLSFQGTQPTGKKLGSVNNLPAWVDDIPSQAEQEATERAWSQNQLRRTDFIMLPDSLYTDEERQKVKTYREALRNPTRTTTGAFPDVSWRPVWPEGVKPPD